MSTVPRTLPQAAPVLHTDLSNPLDQLRGTIRRYVLLEGLLVSAILVVGWFALGMLLDLGVFKAFTWDWVLELPTWFRALGLVFIVALLAGIVALRVFFRLTKEFSYSSLALVLERRFPQQLGDRLITAVELSDVRKAMSYGYSEQMIHATIEEARKRVGQVPVNDVFNWRRLWRMGTVLTALLVGIGAAAFTAYFLNNPKPSAEGFAWRCTHVSTIWAERNLALMHTPWPRRAHLELVGFPQEEVRVSKDAALTNPVKVQVRAVSWVVADRAAEFGWRPMLWSDVPEVLGEKALPELAVAASPGTSANALTVDQVEQMPGLSPDVRGVLDRLHALADRPGSARSVRRLDVPQAVELAYRGRDTSGDGGMTREGASEFSGALNQLKESVSFSVQAEDFWTPRRRVTLVSAPLLAKLVRTQSEPAYLHHAPPDGGTYADLKGLRQRMPDQDVSLTGERSVFSVPAGTEIVLTGTSDKKLTAAYLRPKVGPLPGMTPNSTELIPLTVNEDQESFSTQLSGSWFADIVQALRGPIRVTENLEFDLVFDDTDGIRASRPVLIQKVDDQPPSVDLAVDVLRKQGSVYLATPLARVPFVTESIVRDDRGLSRVEYVFEYSQVEAPVVIALQAQLVARLWASAPVPAGLPSGVMPAFDATVVRLLGKSDVKRKGSALLAGFDDQRQNLLRETKAKLLQDLSKPLPPDRPELIKRVKLENAQKDYFDIARALPELAVPSTEVQPRYRIDLNIQATDANVENPGGPKVGANPEPIRLLVISEADLLVEVSKEEENLILRVDEALRKLKEAKRKLTDVAGTFQSVPPHEIVNLAVRGLDITQDLAKSRDVAQSVLVDYRRILRECEVNQVQKGTIERYRGKIVTPLNNILENESVGTFRKAEQSLNAMQGPLNEARKPDFAFVLTAQGDLDAVIRELQAIRDQLGESLSLDKLRNELQGVINRQKEVRTKLEEAKARLQGQLFLPEIRPAGAVALGKGESKKVKHGMDWKLFDKDDLTIRFKADGDVKVPGELKISADKDEFEYEITAGQKAGEFTVILTPTVGKPVSVRVTVK